MSKELEQFRLLTEYTFIKTSSDSEMNNDLDESLLIDEDAVDIDDFDEENDEGGEGKQMMDGGEESPAPEEESPEMEGGEEESIIDDASEPANDEDLNMDFDTEEEVDMESMDDEVEIDVTEIVNKTEETKAQTDIAVNKMQNILDILGQSVELNKRGLEVVDKLEARISELESELIKRNPTPVEKLELQVTKSSPYNIGLMDYWEKFNAENENYEVSGLSATPNSNNKTEEDDDFVLDTDEIEASYNEFDISKSFDTDEFEEDEEYI